MPRKITKKKPEPKIVPESVEPISSTEPEKIESKKSEPESEIKHLWLAFEALDKNGKKIIHYQGKAAIMRKSLMEQSEVATFIPRDPNEDASIKQIVNLNGYKLEIPKNIYVSLPKQVHEVIRNALQQTEQAFASMNARYGVDRDSRSANILN